MKKTLTWAKIQEHELVTDTTALHDLSIGELMTIFNFVGYQMRNRVYKRTVIEEGDNITVILD
jgi:hypothetical protein